MSTAFDTYSVCVCVCVWLPMVTDMLYIYTTVEGFGNTC